MRLLIEAKFPPCLPQQCVTARQLWLGQDPGWAPSQGGETHQLQSLEASESSAEPET